MAGATSVTVKPSIGHIATDPLRNFKFHAKVYHPTIPNFATLGFISVTGLNITTEVIPYRQGGHNTTTQKMPGQSDFAPITLSKGLAIGDSQMTNWMRQLFTALQGTGTGTTAVEFRVLVDILVLDHPVTTPTVPIKAAFRVYNAWPTSIAFSDLDAGTNSILVQQMVLAHEGFDFKIATKTGASGVSF
jgi:phage tail-like protein